VNWRAAPEGCSPEFFRSSSLVELFVSDNFSLLHAQTFFAGYFPGVFIDLIGFGIVLPLCALQQGLWRARIRNRVIISSFR